MSVYLRLIVRLLVLCVLVIGFVLVQPKPASAAGCVACRWQCYQNFQACGGADYPACQDELNACVADCGC